jgi:DNA-binding transcriptional ArsR family regulator
MINKQTEYIDNENGVTKVTIIENKEKYDRDFKGVWIPKEIWLNEKLSLIEKCLLVEINSLDNEKGCFASNSYFAIFFGISEINISKHIKKLKELGYVKQIFFDGRKRIIKADLSKMIRQDNQNRLDSIIENDKYINIDNNTINKEESCGFSKPPLSAKSVKKVNPYYNDLKDYYCEEFLEDKGWAKGIIKLAIFENGKERKNLASLIEKFKGDDCLDKWIDFLYDSEQIPECVRCDFLPSILIKNYSQIILNSNQELSEDSKELIENIKRILTVDIPPLSNYRKKRLNMLCNRYFLERLRQGLTSLKAIQKKTNCTINFDTVLKPEFEEKYIKGA